MIITSAVLALLMSEPSARDFKTPTPKTSHSYYLPSAIPMEKGSSHWSQKELLWSSLSFGVTENLGLRLDFDAALFGGAMGGLHVGTELGNTGVWFGAGAQAGWADGGLGALAYVNYTIASRDSNATIAIGQYIEGLIDPNTTSHPFIVVAGQLRVFEKLSLVTENWVVLREHENSILSGGVRLFNVRRRPINSRSLDLGVVVWDGFVIPWIDRTWYWD